MQLGRGAMESIPLESKNDMCVDTKNNKGNTSQETQQKGEQEPH